MQVMRLTFILIVLMAVGISAQEGMPPLPVSGLCDNFENGRHLPFWQFSGDWIVIHDPVDPGDPNDRPDPFEGTLTVSTLNSIGMPVRALLGSGAQEWQDYAFDVDVRYPPVQFQVNPRSIDYGLKVYLHYANRLNYVVFEIYRSDRPYWEPFYTRLAIFRNGVPLMRALGERIPVQGNIRVRLVANHGTYHGTYSALINDQPWITMPYDDDDRAFGGAGIEFAPQSQGRAYSRLYFDNVCITPLQ